MGGTQSSTTTRSSNGADAGIVEKPNREEPLQPMNIESSAEASGGREEVEVVEEGAKKGTNVVPLSSWKEWLYDNKKEIKLQRKFLLVTDENALSYSLYTLRFAVMAAAINTKMLNPNFPIMASPGAHPDSFPDTKPFDFNSATYFIPMCSLLGVAISSIFLGSISDRIGRKRVLFVLALISALGSIVKYFTRKTFWGFNIAQFIVGFFLGNLPVAMAYIGDVYTSNKEKSEQLGIIVACYVMGNSGGGVIAILMESSGLFAPLWVGSAICFLSAASITWYLIEPGDVRLQPIGIHETESLLLDLNESGDEKQAVVVEEDDDDRVQRPETIDNCKLWNIIAGALADNIGSTGLFPLCLSPLALEKYTIDFLESDPPEEPIMSITGYKWLSVMVAFMVVPSTQITPSVFNKIGVAGTCVFGNVFTAIITFALLMIGNGPTSDASFYGFVAVMYGGFPFTVFSQLTTGPMLDIIAPIDKVGYVQGLNNAAMNFGMAFAPWLLGMLADAAGTNTAIWTGIAISLGAAFINVPLMCYKDFQSKPPPPKESLVSSSRMVLPGEDEALVERALAGKFVPPEKLFQINLDRAMQGKPAVVPAVTSYSHDKEVGLGVLYRQARQKFRFRQEIDDLVLAEISSPYAEKSVSEMCDLLNMSRNMDDEATVNQATEELGSWMGEYLKDNGYSPHVSSLMLKQMVLTAFPPILQDKEYTPDNIEEALVKERRIMNEFMKVHETKNQFTFSKVLGSGGTQQFYS